MKIVQLVLKKSGENFPISKKHRREISSITIQQSAERDLFFVVLKKRREMSQNIHFIH